MQLSVVKYISLAGLLFLMSFQASAQDFSAVTNAMKAGNAKALSEYFDGSVDVTVVSSKATYSRMQAEMVVKKFFSSHSVTSFSQVHTGSSGNGAKYQIGKLNTTSGSFRTYVYARLQGGRIIIEEIRFEKS